MVDRLRPVNSFIHHPRPETLLPPPLPPSPSLSFSLSRERARARVPARTFPSLFFSHFFSSTSGDRLLGLAGLPRRLSGVKSTNKSNTPRFVPRESSSFTIHEFIMGTTENTAGPPLLIYRYGWPTTGRAPSSTVYAPGGGGGREKIKLTPYLLPTRSRNHPLSRSRALRCFQTRCSRG